MITRGGPRFDAADVGRRVVVRRVVGTRNGRPQFSDLLGELVAVDQGQLTVRTANGQETTVRWDRVVAAKPVPPPPPTRSEVVAVERVAATGWPAVETEWLGEWLLRAAGGWTGRANSVLPLGDPGMPLDTALGRARDWYAARGLPAKFQVPLPIGRHLERELRSRGWTYSHTVLVQTAPLTAVTAGAPDPTGMPEVRITDMPDAQWLRMVAASKRSLPPVAIRVLTGPKTVGFAAVYDDSGDLLAMGRGVADDDWLGISLVEVVPQARRKGLARHLVGTLARWAERHGASRAYVQVGADNEPAQALYQRLGFTTHHRYASYLAPDAETRS